MHRGGRRQTPFAIITPTIPAAVARKYERGMNSRQGMEAHASRIGQVVEKRGISVLLRV